MVYRVRVPANRVDDMTTDVVLPEDVMFHILLWLPVTALLRLKSVCKSWLALIESSDFVDRHFRCHHRNPAFRDIKYNHILMNRQHQLENPRDSGLNFSLLSGDQFEVSRDIDLPGFSKLCFPTSNMVICNGIVCFYHYQDEYRPSNDVCFYHDQDGYRPNNEDHIYVMEIVLWNPATKQLTLLPQSPFRLPLFYECHPPHVQFSVGFGFDVNSNDYKVVRLTLFIKYTELVKSRVEVYSLNTDSWRIVDVSLVNITFIVSEPTTPYRSGTYYCWGARIGSGITLEDGDLLHDHYIVSFDFTKDVFGTIPLPDDYGVKSDCDPQLYFIGDSIACINGVDFSMEAETRCFELWLLNEYGIKESWTKLYKVGPFFRPIQIGISRNGRFLLNGSRDHLWIYDLLSQDIKLILQGRSNLAGSVQVAMYEESLFNIKRGNGVANT